MDSSIRSDRLSSATITASQDILMKSDFKSTIADYLTIPVSLVAQFILNEITGVGNASRFYKCCKDGKVVLPGQCKITRYPEELKHLLTSDSDDAKNFRKYIRSYNTTFACASVRSNIVSPAGRGPYCFRIQGQMYH